MSRVHSVCYTVLLCLLLASCLLNYATLSGYKVLPPIRQAVTARDIFGEVTADEAVNQIIKKHNK